MGVAKRKKQRAVFESGEAPPPEQMARGGVERQFVTHVETGTVTTAHVATHSPVDRWRKAGRLSDSQVAAINLCVRLWDECGLKQKLTASYGERMPPATNSEWLNNTRLQAQRDLRRVEGHVPAHMWEVWENTVRFGEPSGTAGASLGFNGSKSMQAAVRMLCMCVADIIAREERL